MTYSIAILFALLLGAASAHAANSPPDDDDVFTLTVENDSIGSRADRNYTSGIRLNWLQHRQQPSLIARTLGQLVPLDLLNDTTITSASLGQNLYTPTVLSTTTPDPNDRPYAGFLYASTGISSTHDHHTDDLEITMGVIGPAALGYETQQFIHTLLDAPQPQGWEHQLNNEPGLMVSWDRLWPETFDTGLDGVMFRAAPYAGATLGNIFTYANSGVVFQFLPKAYSLQNTPLRVRPALPGNGYAIIPEGDFSWCLFAGLEGRAVGRNIFLDGNTFTDSPSVGKKPLVGDANIGVAFNYGRAQFTYTLNWRSEEFYGQTNADLFGSAGVSYRF